MTIMWPSVIIGALLIIAGSITIVARKNIASGTAEGQRAMFGKAGDKLAQRSTPAGPLLAGVGAIIIGIIAVGAGFLLPPEAF